MKRKASHDPWVIAVVCALYDKCNYSTHCHIPPEAITSKFRSNLRGVREESPKKSSCLRASLS